MFEKKKRCSKRPQMLDHSVLGKPGAAFRCTSLGGRNLGSQADERPNVERGFVESVTARPIGKIPMIESSKGQGDLDGFRNAGPR